MLVAALLAGVFFCCDYDVLRSPSTPYTPKTVTVIIIQNFTRVTALVSLLWFAGALFVHRTTKNQFRHWSDYISSNNAFVAHSLRGLIRKPPEPSERADVDLELVQSSYEELNRFHLSDSSVFGTTDEAADISAQINHKEFKDTFWEDSLEAKQKRNRAHCRQNPRCIQLVADPAEVGSAGSKPTKWIGFTHVLPLTTDGYMRYRNGELQDNTFGARYICSVNQKAAAILIFTIALIPREEQHFEPLGLATARRLHIPLRALHHQLCALMVVHRFAEDEPVLLLAQNDSNEKIRKLLEHSFGFKNRSEKRTGDGGLLFEAAALLLPAQASANAR
jgi:hypothetical protein